MRGRPQSADGMVPELDRAHRVDLQPEQGTAGALRPRSGAPDAGVRRRAGELEKAVDKLFADAEAELAGLSAGSRKAKPLRSLLNHREGLSVFVDNPQVPMDNNAAERAFRRAVIGRRLSFGSDSEDGAKFTAMMYSVVGTLAMNGIDVRRWLQAWVEGLREEWRQAAGRPVALAAMVDERGAKIPRCRSPSSVS